MKNFFVFSSEHPEDDRTFLEEQTHGIKPCSLSLLTKKQDTGKKTEKTAM